MTLFYRAAKTICCLPVRRCGLPPEALTARHPCRRGGAMSKTFKPGDRVVWWKQEGGYVVPVLATVLAVTPKRVKIEAEDEQGDVIRHVSPQSIEHHAPSPKTDRKPGKE